MQRLRGCVVFLLSASVVLAPVCNARGTALGSVIAADRAYVGSASVSVGTTVYGGDQPKHQLGNVQFRAGAARLHLSPRTMGTLTDESVVPGAVLSGGTATFSTANSKAFFLHASTATIRPHTEMPTIAQVIYMNAKEFIVHTTRGALSVSV